MNEMKGIRVLPADDTAHLRIEWAVYEKMGPPPPEGCLEIYEEIELSSKKNFYGKAVRIECPGCGHSEMVTGEQWDEHGVWAFGWENSDEGGTCPNCGYKEGWDEFGIDVIEDEGALIIKDEVILS